MEVRLIRMPDVERMTGLKRGAIYQRLQRGEFPQPRRLSHKCIAWLESDIAEWIKALPAVGAEK